MWKCIVMSTLLLSAFIEGFTYVYVLRTKDQMQVNKQVTSEMKSKRDVLFSLVNVFGGKDADEPLQVYNLKG